MITDTRARIIGYIRINGQARVKDLAEHLRIGNVAVHRHLKSLVASGKLVKSGVVPKVFYRLGTDFHADKKFASVQTNALLDKYYAYVDPVGRFLAGMKGFEAWAQNVGKSNQVGSLLIRYAKDRGEMNRFITRFGWIEATRNFLQTFGTDMSVDGVFYLDFYSLPTFGKTRLGTLMLYAKQSENKDLIWKTADESAKMINRLIKHLAIDAVGYLPHSILRKTQFLVEFEKRLNLRLPKIGFVKAYVGKIRVAQKTLGKLEERIQNAKETIFIDTPAVRYGRVLLIDDAVGSGATLNETAKKLKRMGLAKKVFGFAVVGSLKGFEVIRQV